MESYTGHLTGEVAQDIQQLQIIIFLLNSISIKLITKIYLGMKEGLDTNPYFSGKSHYSVQ